MPAIIKNLARPGIAVNGSLIAIIVVLGALISAMSFPSPPEVDDLSDMELRAALMSCGLTAAPLAAAGATPQQVTALITTARSHLSSRIQALRDAHKDVQNANIALSLLQASVRQGTAGENPSGQLASARANINTAIAARAAIWSGLFDAAVEGIGQERTLTVETIEGNSPWSLPTEYLVANRSEAAWLALRDALDNIRVASQLGQEASPEAVQLLQNVNAETAVAQARVNLGNLEAVSAAWEDATIDP